MFQVGRWFRTMARLLVLAAVLGGSFRAGAEPSREDQLKAVLLFNLVQFVYWPDSTFESTNAPLVIGVLDDNGPLGKSLKEVVRNENLRGHPIVVENYSSMNEIKKCHVLFVSAEERRRFDKVLLRFANQPVLTVSDTEGFVSSGGLVRMYIKSDGKIGLRINANAAKDAGLTISAKLLRLAEIVGPQEARR